MARPGRIDREELRVLVREGWTNAALAAHFCVQERSIRRAKAELGLTRPMLSHKDVIPWTVPERDHQSTEMQYLRRASQLIQGVKLSAVLVNQTGRWLRDLTGRGLDLRYDEQRREWEYFTADRADWHLLQVRKWLEAEMDRRIGEKRRFRGDERRQADQ